MLREEQGGTVLHILKKYGYSGREYYRKKFRSTVNSGNCMKMQNRPFKVQQIAALWLKKGGQVQVKVSK